MPALYLNEHTIQRHHLIGHHPCHSKTYQCIFQFVFFRQMSVSVLEQTFIKVKNDQNKIQSMQISFGWHNGTYTIHRERYFY